MATGKLAKTDRIDAAVLAHFFAEAVRPEPRPLADEHARELSAVVLRRRQILAMTTAEANRARTAPKAVRKRIEAHLRWLRKELARVDGELERVVKESLVWKERADLLMSVPGVGPTLSATLLAELPELEHLETAGVLHRLGRRSGNRLAQRSRDFRPTRSCGKEARSRRSPVALSTAATATDALWGSTPMSTFMTARTSVSVGPLPPSARAKDIPTLGLVPTPLLSHSACRGHRRDASREQANPFLVGDRKFASDPCITGTLEA